MTTTRIAPALLALFLFAAPAPAGPPKDVDDLRLELETLTEAISAQLKLVRIYEEMGKTDEVAATKRQVLNLVERQRGVLDRLSGRLGGEPAAAAAPDRPFEGPSPRPADMGAPASTDEVANRALAWLARNQEAGGFWDGDRYGGGAHYDPGLTGLALLAFLDSGTSHREGPYRENVALGLQYLKQIQDPEGCFGPRTSSHFVYNHAIATQAMVRAFAATRSPLFKQSAQLGLDFIHKAQNPYLAWRYGVRPGDNDTSVTGWMVAALRAGEDAGLRVDSTTFTGAIAWLDKVTDPETGRVGYTARGTGPARAMAVVDAFPAEKSEALTAEGIVTRVHAGQDPAQVEAIAKGAKRIRALPPAWDERDGSIDMYYWYWGARAAEALGGDALPDWRDAMRQVLLSSQRTKGPEAGSFDPVGAWGREGGRVYSTALMALIAALRQDN